MSSAQHTEALRRVESLERELAEVRRLLAENLGPTDLCAMKHDSLETRLKYPEDHYSALLVSNPDGSLCITWDAAAHLIPVLRRYIARGGVKECGEEVLP